MKEQLLLIFELHEEDKKVLKLQKILDQFRPEILEIEGIVQTQQTAWNEKSGKLAELESLKKTREREVETAEIRLRDFQTKLNQIKTNKEYQAALKEIGDTKKNNKAIEDQILELMNQIEQLNTETQEISKNLESAKSNLQKKNEEVATETVRIQSELAQIEQARAKVESQLEPTLLGQYRRVKRGRPEALSEVVGGICQGCRMRIQPQLFIEIQKFQKLHVCPSCQRILYLPEWVGEKAGPKGHEGSNAGQEQV